MHDYEYLTVQPGVYGAGNPFGETGDGLELFERVVENGAGHLRAPELAVVGVGEAVRLIPDPLQEVELGGFAFEEHRLGASRLDDLLVALGERAQRYIRQLRAYLEFFKDRDNRRELALAAVEQDEIRNLGELLVARF